MSYNNIQELFNSAEKEMWPLSQIVLETESALTERSYEDIYNEMERRYEVMKSSAKMHFTSQKNCRRTLLKALLKHITAIHLKATH